MAWIYVCKSVKIKQTTVSEELHRFVKSEKKGIGKVGITLSSFITL